MTQAPLVEIRTFLYGLGQERQARPSYVPLAARTVPARDLLAAHVRAEVERAAASHRESLALHFILADDVREGTPPAEALDAETVVACAWAGLAARRFILSVDGDVVPDLDTPLTLSERSLICLARLVTLTG